MGRTLRTAVWVAGPMAMGTPRRASSSTLPAWSSCACVTTAPRGRSSASTRARSAATAGNPVSTSTPRTRYALTEYPTSRLRADVRWTRVTSPCRSRVSIPQASARHPAGHAVGVDGLLSGRLRGLRASGRTEEIASRGRPAPRGPPPAEPSRLAPPTVLLRRDDREGGVGLAVLVQGELLAARDAAVAQRCRRHLAVRVGEGDRVAADRVRAGGRRVVEEAGLLLALDVQLHVDGGRVRVVAAQR